MLYKPWKKYANFRTVRTWNEESGFMENNSNFVHRRKEDPESRFDEISSAIASNRYYIIILGNFLDTSTCIIFKGWLLRKGSVANCRNTAHFCKKVKFYFIIH